MGGRSRGVLVASKIDWVRVRERKGEGGVGTDGIEEEKVGTKTEMVGRGGRVEGREGWSSEEGSDEVRREEICEGFEGRRSRE